MVERFNPYGAAYLLFLVVAQVTASPPEPAPPPRSDVLLDAGPPVVVEQGRKCVLTVQTTAKKVTWGIPAGVDTLPLDGKRLAVWALPGTYTFRVMVPSGDDVISTELVLTVTGPRPPPVPPDPKPPDPPKPDKPVVGIDGVSVLLVYETADLAKYTKEQAAIPYSTKLYKYLDSVCAPAPDGKTRAWRVWDQNVDGYLDSQVFGDAMKRPRASVPWLIVSSPKGNYEGPWPADADALIALVKKTIGG